MATKTATSQLTDQQVENMLYSVKEKFSALEDDASEVRRIDCQLMRIVARDEFGIRLPRNRSYLFAKSMKYHHPNEFV